MNVHLLGHLAECVKDWGPLWGYSCFSFESANNNLRKLFHGTKNMSKQVHTKLMQAVNLWAWLWTWSIFHVVLYICGSKPRTVEAKVLNWRVKSFQSVVKKSKL